VTRTFLPSHLPEKCRAKSFVTRARLHSLLKSAGYEALCQGMTSVGPPKLQIEWVGLQPLRKFAARKCVFQQAVQSGRRVIGRAFSPS
jgi:hypothetical protein